MLSIENIISLFCLIFTLLIVCYEKQLIALLRLKQRGKVILILFNRLLLILALMFLIKQATDHYNVNAMMVLKFDFSILIFLIITLIMMRKLFILHVVNFSNNKSLISQVKWLSFTAIIILSIFAVVNSLSVKKAYQLFLISILMFLFILMVTLYIKERIINHLDNHKIDKTIVIFVARLFFIIMFLVYAIFVLQIFNISTAPILTVLGAVSLALGLSLQSSLSNLAAGILLIIFRPYSLGNIIKINNLTGTVEDINFLFTKLRTFTGESLNIPNSQFLTAPGISNFTNCRFRRVEVKVGIDYSTDVASAIKTGIKHFENSKDVLKNPAPRAYISDFGASSIDLVFWFYLKPKDYAEFSFAAREKILDAFKQNGIEIPFNRLVIDINREQQGDE